MNKHILVVDDEEGIVRILEINLKMEGYEVDTASCGTDALKLLLTNHYDLLISDIMMPEMDGLELLEHIRQSPALAELPVILLTAQSTYNDITRGYARGTDLYLTKPFSPAELKIWVSRILNDEVDAA